MQSSRVTDWTNQLPLRRDLVQPEQKLWKYYSILVADPQTHINKISAIAYQVSAISPMFAVDEHHLNLME